MKGDLREIRMTDRKHSMAMRSVTVAILSAAALALTGCISLGGGTAPESLITLSSTATPPAGAGASANADNDARAIAIRALDVPAKLDVLRVPVAVSDTELAYLQDAYWVEKPAQLFRRLLGETLRTRGDVLVIDSDDAAAPTGKVVRGTLLDMGYDAGSSSVVVRFEALLTSADGTIASRRFEARESGILADAREVGPALNRAANTIAGEVAEWVLEAK